MVNKKAAFIYHREPLLNTSKRKEQKHDSIKSVSSKFMITDLIPIPCTDREKLHKLRSLIIDIQSAWFTNLFDSGLTFSDIKIWEKMQEAVCLLERRDDPSSKGFDLKTIASNYDLLEQIFIASQWDASGFVLNSNDFKACDLVRIHHFSAIGILQEVEAYRNKSALTEEEIKYYAGFRHE